MRRPGRVNDRFLLEILGGRARSTDSMDFRVADALDVSHVHVGRKSGDMVAERQWVPAVPALGTTVAGFLDER
jgi:hypothetical protein